MQIVQTPNPPLIIALSGLLLSMVPNQIIHKIGLTIYTVAIIVWAYEEIISGANWVRRILGLVVLGTVIYTLFTQLH